MVNRYLQQKPFDASIYSFTLKFKDPDLEDSYLIARAGLTLLATSTKRFLVAILIAHLTIHLIDMLGALGASTDYVFDKETWIVYSFLLPLALLEFFFYCFASLVAFRGMAFTFIGCFVLFHNDYYEFKDTVFYPFVDSE